MDADFRPYAATANVLAVLQRARTRNLPDTINDDFLSLTGVPEVVFGRVQQALLFLDLIHEDDRPTDKLEGLAKAPESEYSELLAGCIQQAYREDFQRIQPGEDDQTKIIDAFRRYKPRSQTSRMVMLFLGMCRAAGIPVRDAPRERRMAQTKLEARPRKSAAPKSNPVRSTAGDPFDPFLTPRVIQSSIFSFSEQDIAALDQADFDEVWSALGKVARARALRLAARARANQSPNRVDEATDRE